MSIICGDAHRFVDVCKIRVVEGIVPLVEGLHISNMLQSMTQSLDQNTRYTKPCVQYKKMNDMYFQNALTQISNFFTH